MKKAILITASVVVAFLSSCSHKGDMTWRLISMDGSRTGVIACGPDNVAQTLGTFDDSLYYAPSGRTFSKETATYKVAKTLIEAQPTMSAVKVIIAESPREMSIDEYPESPLGDWFVDILMSETSRLTGKKVHMGLANTGGVRIDMPKGDVLVDDIISMFPFKNSLCYLEMKGSDIRAVLDSLAANRWQLVGGARCVVKDKRLESVEIDGAPLDDSKTYGVASISFLLRGGDEIYLGKNALKVIDTHIMVGNIMLPYVKNLQSQGKLVECNPDGRIKIIE